MAKRAKSNWYREEPSRLLNELFGGGIILSGLLLFVSIVGELLHKGGLDKQLGIKNAALILGPFGQAAGRGLIELFGIVPFVLVAWLLLKGYAIWSGPDLKRDDYQPTRILFSLLSVLLMIIFTAPLFSLVFTTTAGGVVGKQATTFSIQYINFLGSLALFGVLWLVLFRLLFPIRVRALVVATLSSIVALVRTAFGFIRKISAAITNGIADRLDNSPQEQRPLPKPRSIKPAVPSLREQLEQSEEEDHPVSEPEIVVQVKNRDGKIKMPEVIAHKFKEQINFEYKVPSIDILQKGDSNLQRESDEELKEKAQLIESKLRDFEIAGRVTKVHPGPVVTLFEFEPAPGVKVGRIVSLENDLAMSLRAVSIRVVAPIPGKGAVGIEIPNKQRQLVALRDVLESEENVRSESILTVAFGKDTYGVPVVADIASMPHLLMAGATGTGKSVSINCILLSILYRASPHDLGLILIDPKILELSVYEGIPHLRAPIVTVPRQARAVLEWATREMDRRYRMMQKHGVRNIDSYNQIVSGEQPPELEGIKASPVTEPLEKLPKILIVIDELADLMLQVGREIEELITRLAQKARAAGIHLLLATQRPSVDVITGLIKANFPARLSFKVSSKIDSRTILDCMGADKLLGKGDMLFFRPGFDGLKRVHGAFVSDSEVKKVVEFIKQCEYPTLYDSQIMAMCEKAMKEGESSDGITIEGVDGEGYDEFYDKAVQLVLEKGQASTSMIQRVFRIGYNRAARIIETMEREGVVGPMDGGKGREVLGRGPLTEGGESAGEGEF